MPQQPPKHENYLSVYCPKYRPCFLKNSGNAAILTPIPEIQLIETKLYKETNSADSLLRCIRRSREPALLFLKKLSVYELYFWYERVPNRRISSVH